jgi:chorismate dehydratase
LIELGERLSLARDLGIKSIHDIAAREALLLNLPLATTIQYLTKNLHFQLGSAERSGLRLFYDLAVRRGLAPEGLKLVFRSCVRAG